MVLDEQKLQSQGVQHLVTNIAVGNVEDKTGKAEVEIMGMTRLVFIMSFLKSMKKK